MVKASAWFALVLLTACGGSARTSGQQEPGGSSGSSNGSAAGAPNGGNGSNGSNGGNGGNAVAGAFNGQGGNRDVAGASNAGSAGKLPDFPGGSAGQSPLACNTPYAGPSGGPRSDGPSDLGYCSSIPDAVALARNDDPSARVPMGLYYEPNESITFWREPCSTSLADTVARGPSDGMGTFSDSFATDWFYDAVYCSDGVRRIERNLRCDYFDGKRLANPSPERLAFLASMLWWSEHQNDAGSLILGHSIAIGDATDVVELCTVSSVLGDSGLCSLVQLESTQHRLRADGTVQLGTPQVIRTLLRNCK